MGHRLSRIYTRTGDGGDTGLGDGSRVAKDDARIEAIGTLDELNSALGLLLAAPLPTEVAELLTEVQHHLFDLGGELSLPGETLFPDGRATWLEQHLDRLNAPLAPLSEFILPGGTPAAAQCHVARTLCRRAERRLVRLARGQAVNPAALAYLNRLSDLLFVIARFLNREAGREDVTWRNPGRS